MLDEPDLGGLGPAPGLPQAHVAGVRVIRMARQANLRPGGGLVEQRRDPPELGRGTLVEGRDVFAEEDRRPLLVAALFAGPDPLVPQGQNATAGCALNPGDVARTVVGLGGALALRGLAAGWRIVFGRRRPLGLDGTRFPTLFPMVRRRFVVEFLLGAGGPCLGVIVRPCGRRGRGLVFAGRSGLPRLAPLAIGSTLKGLVGLLLAALGVEGFVGDRRLRGCRDGLDRGRGLGHRRGRRHRRLRLDLGCPVTARALVPEAEQRAKGRRPGVADDAGARAGVEVQAGQKRPPRAEQPFERVGRLLRRGVLEGHRPEHFAEQADRAELIPEPDGVSRGARELRRGPVDGVGLRRNPRTDIREHVERAEIVATDELRVKDRRAGAGVPEFVPRLEGDRQGEREAEAVVASEDAPADHHAQVAEGDALLVFDLRSLAGDV